MMDSSLSPRETLRLRAQKLAVKTIEAMQPGEYVEYLAFQLSGERYAIELRCVREVCGLKRLTPLPGTARFVLGIINLRGRILSVIDIGKLFDLQERGLTDTDRVIVVSDGMMEFGLLANGVSANMKIERSKILPPLPTMTGLRRELMRGVTVDGMAVLDGPRLLSDARIVVRDTT